MNTPIFKKNRKKTIVSILSFSCVIHCLLTPVILLALPSLGSIIENHIIETILLVISIFCGSYILYSGFCTHRNLNSWILYLVGIGLWVLHSMNEKETNYHISLYLISGTCLVLLSFLVNHFKTKNESR